MAINVTAINATNVHSMQRQKAKQVGVFKYQ